MRRAGLTAPTGQLLRTPARPQELARRVVFMFPGQGGQHVDMGRELYESEPVFRRELDAVADLAGTDLDVDLREVLYPPVSDQIARAAAESQLRRMSVGQPAVFIVEYALARLWMDWGVEPAGVVGHSLGAYAAACLAGVITAAGRRPARGGARQAPRRAGVGRDAGGSAARGRGARAARQ